MALSSAVTEPKGTYKVIFQIVTKYASSAFYNTLDFSQGLGNTHTHAQNSYA